MNFVGATFETQHITSPKCTHPSSGTHARELTPWLPSLSRGPLLSEDGLTLALWFLVLGLALQHSPLST